MKEEGIIWENRENGLAKYREHDVGELKETQLDQIRGEKATGDEAVKDVESRC